jgi:hypothetical protein
MPAFNRANDRTPSGRPASLSMSNELEIGWVLDDRFKILDVVNHMSHRAKSGVPTQPGVIDTNPQKK